MDDGGGGLQINTRIHLNVLHNTSIFTVKKIIYIHITHALHRKRSLGKVSIIVVYSAFSSLLIFKEKRRLILSNQT